MAELAISCAPHNPLPFGSSRARCHRWIPKWIAWKTSPPNPLLYFLHRLLTHQASGAVAVLDQVHGDVDRISAVKSFTHNIVQLKAWGIFCEHYRIGTEIAMQLVRGIRRREVTHGPTR